MPVAYSLHTLLTLLPSWTTVRQQALAEEPQEMVTSLSFAGAEPIPSPVPSSGKPSTADYGTGMQLSALGAGKSFSLADIEQTVLERTHSVQIQAEQRIQDSELAAAQQLANVEASTASRVALASAKAAALSTSNFVEAQQTMENRLREVESKAAAKVGARCTTRGRSSAGF